MTKSKWTHKFNYKKEYTGGGGGLEAPPNAICGQITYNLVSTWTTVTCTRCLAKKPATKKKQAETHLDFELQGKVFITERKDDGTIVSQEQIDGEVVLKCLVSLLESGMRTEEKLMKGYNEQNEKNRSE